MNNKEHLALLKEQYNVLAVVDLDTAVEMPYADMQTWLHNQCRPIYRDVYQPMDRIVFTQTGDIYVKQDKLGLVLRNLQVTLMELDISNCFTVLISSDPDLTRNLELAQKLGTDEYPINGVFAELDPWQRKEVTRYPSSIKESYTYGSINPLKISLNDLSKKEQDLITTSKVFCIYPWIHLNANPDGRAYPCCMTDHKHSVGNCHSATLEEIWNGPGMRQVRLDMLNETPIAGCERCYEQEKSGFFSGRLSANKHHGHHIGKILETQQDGTLDSFEMVYWDIRYSNLCNLRCRSCGHIYSSQWYQDQAKLAGPEWKINNSVLNYAGKTKTDMWEQLIPHLDYVEQIYFAGGEPLLMDEHYNILDELERRGRFDVRLIYNTNFTHTKLKDREVFDYWKKFESVSVGASLDGSGARGEYIRKGTEWNVVEQNRQRMLEICPRVDFYVSSTLSIFNAWHLPDFHRDWVERGLIKAQDLNVNILLDPKFYRIDIAPEEYKQRLSTKYLNHILWLRDQDSLNRATQGFESAVTFMNATDNSHLIPVFWAKTQELDAIRNENIMEIIPEMAALK